MKKITLSKKDWDAVVTYFRAEEKIYRDSYGVPGEKKNWPEELKRMEPEAFKLWDAAQKVINKVRK